MPDRARPGSPLVPAPGPGLRLRLWIACLAAPLVAGGLLWWAVGTRASGLVDPAVVWVWLPAIGGLGVLLGLIAALWLDRHVVGHLDGLVQGVVSERVTDLRGLPSVSGWGELSELTQQLQMLLMRHRMTQRSAAELETLLEQLAQIRTALERWNRTERWETLTAEGAALGPVAGLLNRSLGREQAIRDDNAMAARQVRDEVAEAVTDARESAEQAERGFVEATALLTTVKELHRLAAELTAHLQRLSLVPEPAPGAGEPLRLAAAEAIGELITASAESVEHLANGMRRVQEIAEHVQRLANRATLIALNAVAAGSEPEAQAEQLKRLARDVREATERTSTLAAEIEGEAGSATARMTRARTEVAARLERLPEVLAAPAPVATALPEEATRLLERVREMISDATRKGERLSAAGERASRAAQRLARRLEDEARELEGLVVRLTPVAESPAAPGYAGPTEASRWASEDEDSAGPGSLRLLGREERPDADAPHTRGEEAP